MKRFLSYLKGWRGIALTAYMWLILMAYVIVYVDVRSPEIKKRFYIVSVAEVILFALLWGCPRLLCWAENLKLNSETEELTLARKRVFFLRSWLASLAVLSLMYIVFYPGGYSIDSIVQYSQALGITPYNDWHPVLNTLVSFNLPLLLTRGMKGAPALFQMLLFSFALAYMSVVMLEYSNRKYARRFLIYMLMHPATLTIFLSSPKDSSFSIAMLLLTIFGVRVYFTGGKWLQSIPHTILFTVVLTAGTLFRHNAVLYTLPLWFAVSLYIRKRHALLILVCFLGMVYGIRYPLYESMNVARPGRRLNETMGVPMGIIANAVKESPELLDKDVLDFAYSIAPENVYREKFSILSGYVSIKYATYITERNVTSKEYLSESINTDILEAEGAVRVLSIMLKCFRQAPWASLRGFCGVTSLVYSIAGPPMGRIVPVIAPNNLGLSDNKFFDLSWLYMKVKQLIAFSGADDYQISQWGSGFQITGFSDGGSFTLQSLIILCNYAVMVLFKHIFWCIGILNLTVIIFVLARLDFGHVSGWKRLCFALPMLVHNFGTMLLLSGNDFRYFYYSYLVFPLVLLVLLRENSGVKS